MKLGNVTVYSYKYLSPTSVPPPSVAASTSCLPAASGAAARSSGGAGATGAGADVTKALADDVSQMEDVLALHRRLQATGGSDDPMTQVKSNIR